jgi:hypothetical protein
LEAEIVDLKATQDAFRTAAQLALAALEESRDDVNTLLIENKFHAGYEQYDNRIRFYTEQLAKHDAAIAALTKALAGNVVTGEPVADKAGGGV